MSESAQPKAWQPFTPRGVSRFAQASVGRLLALQLFFATIVAAATVWFVAHCYSHVILAAIQALPEEAQISKQELRGLPAGLLAENRFLSIGVDGEESPFSGVGDLRLRLGEKQVKVCSLLGCIELAYPAGWTISLSRSDLEPRWGAWKPMILAGLGLLTIAGLMMAWAGLALLYFWIPKLISFFADRELTGFGAWKLAGAAHMPGALLVVIVLLLYGARGFDLVRFLAFYLLHFPVGWFYLFAAPFFLPRVAAVAPKKRNPFRVKLNKSAT
ncbi:MAG: hypothetical protein ACK4UN_13785 [Limisphaerales bacterium]